MANARAQKLKVFRTPIGFHDAYVAAPSQKAALEAWGSDSNLFASGAAEQVSELELMVVPMERPGEVIKVLRGTRAEQVAALGEMAKGGKKSGRPRIKSGVTTAKKPKPSRAAADEAEEAVEALRRRQAKELAAADQALAEAERARRELKRRQQRELEEFTEQADAERSRLERALEAWKTG